MPRVESILSVDRVSRDYRRRSPASAPSILHAVIDVTFELARGSALGIVGRSGSGKSTLSRLVLALEKPDRGVIRFEGHPISNMTETDIRPLRKGFQAVFQDPSSSLNPTLTVGTIVSEPLVAHSIGNPTDRRSRVRELLVQVGLDADCIGRRPDAFSGGERQRIAIARALAPGPRLLVLDEPTSSLDMPVQAQILDLVAHLQRAHDLSLVFISHDLGVVREICDEVAVMHRGRMVEIGPTQQILDHPKHQATKALLAAVSGTKP